MACLLLLTACSCYHGCTLHMLALCRGAVSRARQGQLSQAAGGQCSVQALHERPERVHVAVQVADQHSALLQRLRRCSKFSCSLLSLSLQQVQLQPAVTLLAQYQASLQSLLSLKVSNLVGHVELLQHSVTCASRVHSWVASWARSRETYCAPQARAASCT